MLPIVAATMSRRSEGCGAPADKVLAVISGLPEGLALNLFMRLPAHLRSRAGAPPVPGGTGELAPKPTSPQRQIARRRLPWLPAGVTIPATTNPRERTAMRTTYGVNDMTIHRIVEQEHGFTPMLEFLPTLSKDLQDENLSWLAPGGYDKTTGNVVLCFQSYVVKTPHHNILVDACI